MQISSMLDSTKLLSSATGSTSTRDLQRLADRISVGTDEQAEQKMKDVAQNFEAIFTSMLLKGMRETLTEGLFGSDQGDVYGGLFDLLMGQQLAKQAPLGVDRMVEKYLESEMKGSKTDDS